MGGSTRLRTGYDRKDSTRVRRFPAAGHRRTFRPRAEIWLSRTAYSRIYRRADAKSIMAPSRSVRRWICCPIFRRGLHLISCEPYRDTVVAIDCREMKRIPSTAIFCCRRPEKPPKSMTAARTVPTRSTITSMMRPIFPSAALRTSRPSTPCASWRSNATVAGRLAAFSAGWPGTRFLARRLGSSAGADPTVCGPGCDRSCG